MLLVVVVLEEVGLVWVDWVLMVDFQSMRLKSWKQQKGVMSHQIVEAHHSSSPWQEAQKQTEQCECVLYLAYRM